ncbi:MAG: hypothetical protein CMF11_09845 [Idiomarina sp.]|jgi:hypothetical protein|nr:hypothetical protein [Idiomarina sp.]|tara:strand:- start:203 stop:442 length:240 start_codon:yes stop_codon:yes gene_type:complete
MSEKTEKLNVLQDILINEFIERIQSGAATPSDLNAARQLLKDNGVHAQVTNDNPLGNLVEMLPFRDDSEHVVLAANERL